jgi:hypothetical protein
MLLETRRYMRTTITILRNFNVFPGIRRHFKYYLRERKQTWTNTNIKVFLYNTDYYYY